MFRNWKDLLSLKLDQFLCSQDRIARYKQFKEFQKRIMAPRKGKGWDCDITCFFKQFAMWNGESSLIHLWNMLIFHSYVELPEGNFPIIFLSLPPEKWEYCNRIHTIPLKHGNISGGDPQGSLPPSEPPAQRSVRGHSFNYNWFSIWIKWVSSPL